MRVIAKKTIREFWLKHKDCQEQPLAWHQEAEDSDWSGPADIKRSYPAVSIIAGNRVVFNIVGNRYRLVVKINYEYRMVWIRFIGTHAQYDRIDAETI